MQIISNYLYNRPTPKFAANYKTVKDFSGKVVYRKTSYMFRPDLRWNEFVQLLAEKYKNVPKVNIINHACSDGQEPFSLVTKLVQVLKEKAEKFLPVIAKDIDKDNIINANRRRLTVEKMDFQNINNQTSYQINNWFNIEPSYKSQNELILIPKDSIKNKVIFEQGDIFNDINHPFPDNTVFLCRNFWPYLTENQRDILAQRLSKNLNKTSLLVVGDFDQKESRVYQLLAKYGFKPTKVPNVYSKV